MPVRVFCTVENPCFVHREMSYDERIDWLYADRWNDPFVEEYMDGIEMLVEQGERIFAEPGPPPVPQWWFDQVGAPQK